jgi:regulator of RNase E activity RraA
MLLSDKIGPIPSRLDGNNRIVAPVSTIIFVSKDHQPGRTSAVESHIPEVNNLPKDKHWTDVAAPGSVILMQQPADQTVAVLGDIVATRFKTRGVLAAVVDGRVRDNTSCGMICKDGGFQVWTKGMSSAGTSLQAKPWAVDVPVRIGLVKVKPGDVICMDDGESVSCVIPRERLEEVFNILPKLKEADDAVLADVQRGVGLKEAFAAHPDHYTNH